jgi:hypothetical protein
MTYVFKLPEAWWGPWLVASEAAASTRARAAGGVDASAYNKLFKYVVPETKPAWCREGEEEGEEEEEEARRGWAGRIRTRIWILVAAAAGVVAFTLVPIRPRSRGERRSLRTSPTPAAVAAIRPARR